jgi:hypothetical protein
MTHTAFEPLKARRVVVCEPLPDSWFYEGHPGITIKDWAAQIENIVFEAMPNLYKVDELVNHMEGIGYSVTKNSALYLALR